MSLITEKPAPTAVVGVAALNRMVRDMLEHALPLLWVRGEVSNFNCAPSGHCYFTLKDANAQVRCTLFRSRAQLLDWQPHNGMQIEVRALATLFEPRGDFQLNVESMRRAGMGALYEAFERLKHKLGTEGLFAAEYKKSLPVFPRRIGIVTSPQAAALRDVLSILRQRFASLPVVIYPTPVQGAAAGASIARAIDIASRRTECDVLILCRGGGSIEDLWAFNEEAVARAIHRCAIPIVSGVGHETDFTIADFVADLRAPTPSAAAQAVCSDRRELRARVDTAGRRLQASFVRYVEQVWQGIDYLGRRLVDPHERLRAECRHLLQLCSRLAQAGRRLLSDRHWRATDLLRRLSAASIDPQHNWNRLQHARMRLQAAHGHAQHGHGARMESLGARLHALDPQSVLDRGYAIASDANGRIVRDAASIAAGEALMVRFARGQANTQIVSTTVRDAGDLPDS